MWAQVALGKMQKRIFMKNIDIPAYLRSIESNYHGGVA